MATNRFVGGAAAVAQVDTFTPGGTIEIGDIFILTSTGWDGVIEVVTFTATDTTPANVSVGLIAAWNASTSSACIDVTASGTVTVILTADTAGVAFSVVGTTTEAGGGAADDQTFSRAATTKNEGPNDWSSVANWSEAAVPVADDDVYIEGTFTILYGLAQSAIELDSLNRSGARIGTNPAPGWRPVYLAIGAPIVDIGYHYGPSTVTQSVPVNLDLGTVASVITIHDFGTNGTSPAVRITCKHADTTLEVRKGKVGFYNNADGDAELDIINIGYVNNKAGDSDVYIEPGCTIDTINQRGGNLNLRSALTTALTMDAGTLKTEGSGAITTLTINGGTADFTKSAVSRTVTNLKLNPGGMLRHDPASTDFTNWTEPDNPVTLSASAA